MNVRDLKLAVACGNGSEEVKALNKFFDDLFSSLTIYTDGEYPDLIFMKGDICFMKQDLKNAGLWCRYKDFWKVLECQYHCTYEEIQGIIQYKVEEAFKMRALTPAKYIFFHIGAVEEAFKMGSLTPKTIGSIISIEVEKEFEIGSLTPYNK